MSDFDHPLFPILIGDIGGTNARFAVIEDVDAEARHLPVAHTHDHKTFEDAIEKVVFADGVVPNEADVEDTDAVPATAMVHPVDNGDGTVGHAYEVGYLVAGDYEVAFTCDGTVFEPADGKPATIAAGEVTTVDFP